MHRDIRDIGRVVLPARNWDPPVVPRPVVPRPAPVVDRLEDLDPDDEAPDDELYIYESPEFWEEWGDIGGDDDEWGIGNPAPFRIGTPPPPGASPDYGPDWPPPAPAVAPMVAPVPPMVFDGGAQDFKHETAKEKEKEKEDEDATQSYELMTQVQMEEEEEEGD